MLYSITSMASKTSSWFVDTLGVIMAEGGGGHGKTDSCNMQKNLGFFGLRLLPFPQTHSIIIIG